MAAVVLVLVAWELVGRSMPPYLFAPPSGVLRTLLAMVGSGELRGALGRSVAALLLGYGLAVVVGTCVGLAMGSVRLLGHALDPIVAALYVVPLVALVPLVVAWAGIDLLAHVIVIFGFAVLDVTIATQAGVRSVDPGLTDVARCFGAGRFALFSRIVLPASVPFLFVGYRIGASRAVTGTIVAEMFFALTGLGGLIVRNANAFRIDEMLAVVVVVALVGVGLTAAVRAVERAATRRWVGEA